MTAQGAGTPTFVTLSAVANQVRYHSQSGKLAVVCADKQLRVFDSTNGSLLEQVATADVSADVAFLPAGDSVVAQDGSILIIRNIQIPVRSEGQS